MRTRTIETPERDWIDARWIRDNTGLSYQSALNILLTLHPAKVGGRYLARRRDYDKYMETMRI